MLNTETTNTRSDDGKKIILLYELLLFDVMIASLCDEVRMGPREDVLLLVRFDFVCDGRYLGNHEPLLC